MALNQTKVELRRKESYDFCANKTFVAIKSNGIWCLQEFSMIPPYWKNFLDKHHIMSTDLIPAQQHVPPDVPLATSIIRYILEENKRANGTPPVSIIDIGAGIGQYGSFFQKVAPTIVWKGYDGAGNVEAFTQGKVKWIDVTDSDLDTIDFVADWVISLEVGEHIPANKTESFLNLLHRHNKKGILLSWAIKGQGGHGHINEKNNDEVTNLVAAMGYYQNVWTKTFTIDSRKVAQHWWFQNSFMVFLRGENKTFHSS